MKERWDAAEKRAAEAEAEIDAAICALGDCTDGNDTRTLLQRVADEAVRCHRQRQSEEASTARAERLREILDAVPGMVREMAYERAGETRAGFHAAAVALAARIKSEMGREATDAVIKPHAPSCPHHDRPCTCAEVEPDLCSGCGEPTTFSACGTCRRVLCQGCGPCDCEREQDELADDN